MMIRLLLLLLVCATLALRASEPIPAPTVGNSATVTQPRTTAELIPDFNADTIQAGKPFLVALHLHADPGWHTYWINPGDAGLATTIKWTLPPGFTAGPIQWPTPEKHNMGPLVTYGYEGDVYLLTTITPPASRDKWPLDVVIKAKADWLVCQEECIPGKAELSFRLEGGMTKEARTEDALRAKFFAAALQRFPVPNKGWDVTGTYSWKDAKGKEFLHVMLKNKAGRPEKDMGTLQFFPEQANVLDATAQPKVDMASPTPSQFNLWIPLQQNGEKPAEISGVLVSDVPLVHEKTGDSHAVYIANFPVVPVAAAIASSPSSVAVAGPRDDAAPSGGPATTGVPALSGFAKRTGGSPSAVIPSADLNPAPPTTGPITATYGGASPTVTQPHVTAELIPSTTAIEPGEPFDVALHLHADPDWHTYWINPGDSGLATTIKWTLPPGFTAGPIQWPTPEIHKLGPLVSYGYGGDVYLLTTITPPKGDLPQHFEIAARADWLVCKEECIPGKADLKLPLDGGLLNLRLPIDNKDFFTQAKARLPVPNTRWDVKAAFGKGGGTINARKEALWIDFQTKADASTDPLGHLYFFPEQANVLSADESDNGFPRPNEQLAGFQLPLTLQRNGEKPAKMSGVLLSDRPLIGNSRAVYIPAFPTDAKDVPATVIQDAEHFSASGIMSYVYPHTVTKPSLGTVAATSEAEAPGTHRPPEQGEGGMMAAAAAREAQPFLIAVLGAAFIGGLILNLMPCVLPVLSLKVFSLIKHAEHAHSQAWRQGVAFTVGVVISFWLLAGLLLFLRAAGNQLGWGFQMQSPGFVLALIFIFFLLALNLFGVFELGTSLVGLDAKVAGRHNHGLFTSFLNGALATLAATPCTAPFMGSSLGFAAQQPAYIALLIFTFLALGMAAPYLLLTIFPAALKFVPKPGAWMEAFKQFMGFLLMATVIFLLYVLGALTGEEYVPAFLGALLLASVAAWIYGRWASPLHSLRVRLIAFVLVAAFIGFAINWGIVTVQAASYDKEVSSTKPEASGDWQPWSTEAVQQALAAGHPVFVDFTAAWCLSCKVNERVALDVDSVRNAFAAKNVILFKADWTHADPKISEALRQYNRDGVPLYLLYSPKNPTQPQVLPEVLTPGIVLDALNRL